MVSDSEFSMWRAIFAFALVDNILTIEEQALLQSYESKVPFSNAQRDILKQDFTKPQDVVGLYRQISEAEDKKRFCVLARALTWCDGDMDRQEAGILKKASCFGVSPDSEILASTRDDPHIQNYYQQYAKAGVSGLFKVPPSVAIQV